MAMPDLSGLRVLLVDDHRDSADSMGWLLQTFGCATECCFDGTSALERAGSFQPHVVFLDIRLPDMPGTEVCRRLLQQDWLSDTLLVALSGATDDDTVASIDAAGFHHRLTKPVELDEVMAVLRGVER